MTRENKKIKKNLKKTRQILLDKTGSIYGTLPRRLSVGLTYVHLWFIYYYASSNVGTSQITIGKGKETGH